MRGALSIVVIKLVTAWQIEKLVIVRYIGVINPNNKAPLKTSEFQLAFFPVEIN